MVRICLIFIEYFNNRLHSENMSFFCVWAFVTSLLMTLSLTSCELLHNGGFENGMHGWHCQGFHCEILGTADSHDGHHAIRTHGRTHHYQGLTQTIQTVPGKEYQAKSWVKILNDVPGTLGQGIRMQVQFHLHDNTYLNVKIAKRPMLSAADGWVFMQGEFQVPSDAVGSVKFSYQGPAPAVDYAVDSASVTEILPDNSWRNQTDDVINRIRKSDLHLHVTADSNIDLSAVEIQVLQKRKAFPFGVMVKSKTYVDPSQQSFRDFVHRHFNWAVPANALKWKQLDNHQTSDDTLYPTALDTIQGLKNAGLKIRGHNMVWSVESHIPDSVRAKSGAQLRATVLDHIQWTLNQTRGYLEHWDVNNENLHGQWFQEKLQDRDYDLELFRMMHQADAYPKLFLNDYNVVARGSATSAYLAQAQRFKQANVHLYGVGAQCHFHESQEPNPTLMKERLDTLSKAGAPIWATELDVSVADENLRADYIERAMRALYGHPSVEGIMLWHILTTTATDHTAMFYGDNMQPTAAGRRVLDLLETQWMTDTTVTPTKANDLLTVRAFHGDYELHVRYHGRDLGNLKQTFTLGKTVKTLNVRVQV